MWAYLAFLRHLSERGTNAAGPDEAQVLWNVTLPQTSAADQPADPNEVPWFYPGSWFGVSGPVPTLQLKWLRQAEQDYEYLRLAQEPRQKRFTTQHTNRSAIAARACRNPTQSSA